MAGKLVTLASTDPDSPRRMIRFDAAADWFEGLDAAKLATAIATGIGDATPNGIELVNQTISAKLIASGEGLSVMAYDAVTGEHVPMSVDVTLKVTRRACNAAEHARIERVATERKQKQTAKQAADAAASERNIEVQRENFKQGSEFGKGLAAGLNSGPAPAPKSLAEQLRDAAEVLAVVQSLTPKALPSAQ